MFNLLCAIAVSFCSLSHTMQLVPQKTDGTTYWSPYYYYGQVLKPVVDRSKKDVLPRYKFAYMPHDYYEQRFANQQSDALAHRLRSVINKQGFYKDIKATDAYQQVKEECASDYLYSLALNMLASSGNCAARFLIIDMMCNDPVESNNTEKIRKFLADTIEILDDQVAKRIMRLDLLLEKSFDKKNFNQIRKTGYDNFNTEVEKKLKAFCATGACDSLYELANKDSDFKMKYVQLLACLLPMSHEESDLSNVQKEAIDYCVSYFKKVDEPLLKDDQLKNAQFKVYASKAESVLNSNPQEAIDYYKKIAHSPIFGTDRFHEYLAALYLYDHAIVSKEKMKEQYGVAINWPQKKAINWGRLPALTHFNIALNYMQGNKVLAIKKDMQKAYIECQKLLALFPHTSSEQEQNVIRQAAVYLGDMYNWGVSSPENSSEQKSSKKNKKKNNKEAFQPIERDSDKAIICYQKAFDRGYTSRCGELAELYYKRAVNAKKSFDDKDYVLAYKMFQEKTKIIEKSDQGDHGFVVSKYYWYLGQMALLGMGIKHDHSAAIAYFRKATTEEVVYSKMGEFIGISDKNLITMMKLKAMTAIKNNATDEDSLFWCYLAGRMLNANNNTLDAIKVIRHSSNNGHHLSQWYITTIRPENGSYFNDINKKLFALLSLKNSNNTDELTRKCATRTLAEFREQRIFSLLCYEAVLTQSVEELADYLTVMMSSPANVEYLYMDLNHMKDAQKIIERNGTDLLIQHLAKNGHTGARCMLARLDVCQGRLKEAKIKIIELLKDIDDEDQKVIWSVYLDSVCMVGAENILKTDLFSDDAVEYVDRYKDACSFLYDCYKITGNTIAGIYLGFLLTENETHDYGLDALLDQHDLANKKSFINQCCNLVNALKPIESYNKSEKTLINTLLARIAKQCRNNRSFNDDTYFNKALALFKGHDSIIEYLKRLRADLKDANKKSIIATYLESCHLYDQERKYDEAFKIFDSFERSSNRIALNKAALFLVERYLYDNDPRASLDRTAGIIKKIFSQMASSGGVMIMPTSEEYVVFTLIDTCIESDFAAARGKRAVALKERLDKELFNIRLI